MTALTWIRARHALTREVRTFAAELPLPPGWRAMRVLSRDETRRRATRFARPRQVTAHADHVVAHDGKASS